MAVENLEDTSEWICKQPPAPNPASIPLSRQRSTALKNKYCVRPEDICEQRRLLIKKKESRLLDEFLDDVEIRA